MTEATRQLCLTLRHMNRRGIKLLVERAMALPATPSATLPSAATLTSSELYTQTLAAQKDVLRAAAAWPVLVNSLTEFTNPPDRQQLAIISWGAVTWIVAGEHKHHLTLLELTRTGQNMSNGASFETHL